MDTRTGVVTDFGDVATLRARRADNAFLVPVEPKNMPRRNRKELFQFGKTVIGPRARCPCGSGRRFKRCCMGKIGEAL